MSYEEMESVEMSVDTNHCGGGCSSGCVCQVVRAIKDIQEMAVEEEECPSCPTNCFIEPLGGSPVRSHVDTRVFTLTNKNGELFKALFKGRGGNCVSVYFRVEEIFDNCCATLRVLVPLNKEGEPVKITHHGDINYEALCAVRRWGKSSSCITVDLHCFCAVQCIADVNLQLCD
ncbi:spore coat protein Y [Bacillus sp. J14TS2]|uniref:CotY/CotZ family spore coat protein n=1 Tax=Bacillus sp. J14TS2 TaxID=2807188 RepID=UPI001B117079|nr:spore coat protein Y [Bacillus sp. J14TS2]